MSTSNELTAVHRNDLRAVAAMIVPASDEYKVPGADDSVIQADMLKTLGRDTALVVKALDHLARLAGKPLAALDPAKRDAVINLVSRPSVASMSAWITASSAPGTLYSSLAGTIIAATVRRSSRWARVS